LISWSCCLFVVQTELTVLTNRRQQLFTFLMNDYGKELFYVRRSNFHGKDRQETVLGMFHTRSLKVVTLLRNNHEHLLVHPSSSSWRRRKKAQKPKTWRQSIFWEGEVEGWGRANFYLVANWQTHSHFSPRYFYWGGGDRPSPSSPCWIDATDGRFRGEWS